MPQTDLCEELVIPSKPVKTLDVARDIKTIIKSVLENGFAFVDPDFLPPWSLMEKLMSRFDDETVDRINSFYNDKKIIKSSAGDNNTNIDKKLAFDVCKTRLRALEDNGQIEG